MPLALPIGAADFRDARSRPETEHYVDKSGFIGRVLRSNTRALVFCRPRRFGKTLNLTMLREWIEQPIPRPRPAADPFSGLTVLDDALALAERGQHPVLYLSLKGCKLNTWAGNLVAIRGELQAAWVRLGIAADAVPKWFARQAKAIEMGTLPDVQLAGALKSMSVALAEMRGRPVWVLIDEYDAPVQTAWEFGFYDDAVEFLRPFLGQGIKDNTAVHRAVLTGILRVAKEGIFSEMNNVVIDTVLDDNFASDFGFTEAEVQAMAGDEPAVLAELRAWYNGYQIGGQAIYNPWSVANALGNPKSPAKAYWMASGGTKHLQRAATHSAQESASHIEALLSGETVELPVIEGVVMPEIEQVPEMLMNLLLHTGYVTATGLTSAPRGQVATVRVPNNEVRQNLQGLFDRLLAARLGGMNAAEPLIAALLAGDTETVQEALQRLVMNLMSYHDLADTTPERVYHLFVLGILTRVPPGYRLRSNREFGAGRPDIVMEPPDDAQPAVVMEFKQGKSAAAACKAAEKQVRDKRYAEGVRGQPVQCWAVGFSGKGVAVRLVAG